MRQSSEGADVPWLPTEATTRDFKLRTVCEEYLENGATIDEIAVKYDMHPAEVRGIVKNSALRLRGIDIGESVKEKLFHDKVPVLEAIGDTGLIAIYEWMDNLVKTGAHKKMDVEEIKKVTEIVEKLHTMYRLNIGKSTQNIAMMMEQSKKNINEIIIELQAPSEQGGDPFGNYGNTK